MGSCETESSLKLSFPYMQLAYCATGPGGGGKDPSCGKDGGPAGASGNAGGEPKFSDDTKNRVILAAQASLKAKDEKNNIKAAQLHGKAERANAKAVKAIQSDMGKMNSADKAKAYNLLKLHQDKEKEHGQKAKELSEKLLGADQKLAKEREKTAEEKSMVAAAASKAAMGVGQSGVKMYAGGNMNPLARAIGYAKEHSAHQVAAQAHKVAGNADKAASHHAAATKAYKQWEYHRSML